MTRSLYIIGGAGTGKSTFLQEVLFNIGAELGEYQILHEVGYPRRGGATVAQIRLRGQPFEGGVYLGQMREEFPGTDALDNACVPVAREWLKEGELPELIVGEGMLLSTIGFLTDLAEATDLMVVHLTLPEEKRQELVAQRGHAFDPSWSAMTVTRARNSARGVAATRATLIETQYVGEDCRAVDLATLHCMGL